MKYAFLWFAAFAACLVFTSDSYATGFRFFSRRANVRVERVVVRQPVVQRVVVQHHAQPVVVERVVEVNNHPQKIIVERVRVRGY